MIYQGQPFGLLLYYTFQFDHDSRQLFRSPHFAVIPALIFQLLQFFPAVFLCQRKGWLNSFLNQPHLASQWPYQVKSDLEYSAQIIQQQI